MAQPGTIRPKISLLPAGQPTERELPYVRPRMLAELQD